ncbi:MAG: hypothetical protein AAF288_07300 [Planctomycetota bacterium]
MAVVLRLVLMAAGPLAAPDRALAGDSPRYIELAENLLATGTFALAGENSGHVHLGLTALRESRDEMPPRNASGLLPETFRTPGYPALIALPLALGLPAGSVLVLHALMAGALSAVMYRIGRDRLGSPGVGLAAAVVVALHPGLIAGDLRVLSEGPFALALWLGVWLAWPRGVEGSKSRENKGYLAAALGGLCLGAAALIRPIAAPLALCITAWRVVAGRPGRRKQDAVAAACIVLGAAAPVALWSARNAQLGQGASLSSVPAINAWYYTAVHMDLMETGGDWSTDWPAAVAAQHDKLRAGLEPDESVTEGALRLASARFASDPALYAKAMARSGGKFALDHSVGTVATTMGWPYTPMGLREQMLSGDVTAVLRRPMGWVPLGWTGFNGLLALLAMAGAMRLVWIGYWREAALLAGLVVGVALATQTNGLERFRLPVVPAMALLAAGAWLPRRHVDGPASVEPKPGPRRALPLRGSLVR